MSYRIRRVARQFRVEHNVGRGQIVAVGSFPTRREADALLAVLVGAAVGAPDVVYRRLQRQ